MDKDSWLFYQTGKAKGYLNVPEIYKRHPKATMFVFLGSRQIGKTYNTLDLMHQLKEQFIYLRLTEDERLMALSGKANIFAKMQFPWASEMDVQEGKPCYCYCDTFEDGKQPLIMATSLQQLNHMRGYAWKDCKHILVDEFIPMKEAYKRKGQGKVLADCYMTINSTREIDMNSEEMVDNSKAVKLWLLANTNDLNGDIVSYWDLTYPILRMKEKHQQYAYYPERGLVIINCESSPISGVMQRTALYKMLGHNTDYAKVSINNEFADNDSIGIKSCPIKEYIPQFCFDGYNVYVHKNNGTVYVAEGGKPLTPYYDTRNATHLSTLRVRMCRLFSILPVDGIDIFYSSYCAKIATYGVLNYL